MIRPRPSTSVSPSPASLAVRPTPQRPVEKGSLPRFSELVRRPAGGGATPGLSSPPPFTTGARSPGDDAGGNVATATGPRPHDGLERGSEHPRDRRDPAALAEDQRDACLDPLSRALHALAPPETRLSAIPAATAGSPPPALLDEVLARVLTRFAFSGDKKRGTSHLQVGAGALAGGSITLEADGDHVHVRIDAPPGVDARAFGEAVRNRLLAKGLVPTVEVR